jgi:bacteriochlorophyllide a dehydrogenase
MSTLKAIVFPEANKVEIQEFPLPALRADELLVKTEVSGVSQGTELWALTARRPELSFPTVPGYQGIGTVEAVGENVTNFTVGQRVFFTKSRTPKGTTPTWMGTHQSHAFVTADKAIPLPEGADPIGAVLSALPAVSLRGHKMIDINLGDLVVVTGQGLIGQGSAQLAKLRGAIVVAADANPGRLALSQKYSADVVVNVKEESLADVVKKIRPQGADAVIETTGRSDMFAPATSLLRPLGHLLLQGWYPDEMKFDFHVTHAKRPRIAVPCGFDLEEAATCLELMKWNKLRWRELATHVVSFEEAPSLYVRMLEGDPEILGVVFQW